MDGQTIREIRRRLGLTQRQLADKLSVDQGTISRWERGVEQPRPKRVSILRNLLHQDEERRHLNRCLAFVRNDVLPATMLDERLRMVEISPSGAAVFRSRGQDPSRLIGMNVERYLGRIGKPMLLDHIKSSGLINGDALFFRFTVNSRGVGNTTVWEPIFVNGRLTGVYNFVSAFHSFAKNDEFTIERVEFVPADNPDKLIPLHKGERYDQIGAGG